MVDVLKSNGSPGQIGTDAMRRDEIGTVAQAICGGELRRSAAGAARLSRLLDAGAVALHDHMMRAPGDGATRKN